MSKRCISFDDTGFASGAHPLRAGCAVADASSFASARRCSQTSLSLGLSVFQARLAQRSTRDLAGLS
ncbi:MAG: hypothetical protein EOP92_21320 [Lysobacteraceae bacterium]|nr:MAG: hypothetical protein EOP92_21320 [Xanthomonadaceae bacterium]